MAVAAPLLRVINKKWDRKKDMEKDGVKLRGIKGACGT